MICRSSGIHPIGVDPFSLNSTSYMKYEVHEIFEIFEIYACCEAGQSDLLL